MMTVRASTMCILSDSLLEQTPIRRQVSASASDGADDIPGSPGTARRRGIRIADQRFLGDVSVEERPRHVVPPRFPREGGVPIRANRLTTTVFMDG